MLPANNVNHQKNTRKIHLTGQKLSQILQSAQWCGLSTHQGTARIVEKRWSSRSFPTQTIPWPIYAHFSWQNPRKNPTQEKQETGLQLPGSANVKLHEHQQGFVVILGWKLPKKRVCNICSNCIWDDRMPGRIYWNSLWRNKLPVSVNATRQGDCWSLWTSVSGTFILHLSLFPLNYTLCNRKKILEVFFKQHWYISVVLCLEIQFPPVLSLDKKDEKETI